MRTHRLVVVSLLGCWLFTGAPDPVSAQWITFSAETDDGADPSPVRAFLGLPVESGRLAAVVMLTSCEGRKPFHQTWAEALSERGYVTLVVDDYFMHDRPRTCGISDPRTKAELLRMRVRHALGAARYLSTRPDVDGRRIAVMGWGDAPLGALIGERETTAPRRSVFAATVAVTPSSCEDLIGSRSHPVLALRAESDAGDHGTCVAPGLDVRVYQGTVRGFDDPQAGVTARGSGEPSATPPARYDRLAHARAIEDVTAFLARAFPPASPPSGPSLASAPAARAAQHGVWAIDPSTPGPDLPPAGASVFDAWFNRVTPSGIVYDVPYPFSRLLRALEQAAGSESMSRSPLDVTLIPLGRSLQREAAAPDYFESPRIVVAVTGEPGEGMRPAEARLKNRLFLGYQPRADTIEIISYNEAASRFEFQIVRDYAAGREPRVGYARRALCTSCHQNAAPIFSNASWDETTANADVVHRLSALGPEFHGVAVGEASRAVTAIDIATDEANLVPVYRLLWAQGCASRRATEAAQCRAGMLQAMIQYRLSGSAGFDRTAALYADGYLPLQRRNWSERWPDGLLIPNPNLPNRAPLLSPSPSVVPAALDPLRERPPLTRWQASSTRDLDTLVRRLSHSLPEGLVATLARYLRDAGTGAAGYTLTAACRVARRGLSARTGQLQIECGDRPETGRAFYLKALLQVTQDGVAEGEASWLEVGGGSYARRRLTGRVEASDAESRVVLRLVGEDGETPIRSPDGNLIAGIVVSWGRETAERAAPLVAAGVISLGGDFRPVSELLQTEAARASPSSPLLATRFDGVGLARWLLAELGALPATECCQPRPTPTPRLDFEAGSTSSALSAALEHRGPLLIFERYCSACHGNDTTFPPGFLHGPAAMLPAKLSQCAERIFFRLSMWQWQDDEQTVQPMPPAQGLSLAHTTPGEWRQSESLERLTDYARQRLIEAGRDPRAVLEGGYGATRACLATRSE